MKLLLSSILLCILCLPHSQAEELVGIGEGGLFDDEVFIEHDDGSEHEDESEDESESEDATADKPDLSEAEKKKQEADKIKSAFVSACTRFRYERPSDLIVNSMADHLAKKPDDKIPETESDKQRIQRLGGEQAAQFKAAVMRGEWKYIKEQLKPLNEQEQRQVYTRMINGLNRSESVLLPVDVLGVAEAWPLEYDNNILAQLSRLVRKSFQRIGNSGSLVNLLQQGTEHFGGTDQSKRALAVSLLLAADLIKEAGVFLPPLNEARASDDPKILDVHARYLSAIGTDNNNANKDALRNGWALTLEVLAHEKSDVETIRNAVQRSLSLLLLVDDKEGQQWLHESFAARPDQGMRLLGALSQRLRYSIQSEAMEPRLKSLELQHRIINSLVQNSSADMTQWSVPINIIAMSWIQEADLALNQVEYQNYEDENIYYNQQDDDMQPIDAAVLLEFGPQKLWYPHLDSGLAQRMHSLNGALMCKAGDISGAMDIISELSKTDINEAQSLASNVLLVWAQQHRPERGNNYDQYNNYNYNFNSRYYGGGYYQQQQQGIPLTRAKQNKYLVELASLLKQLHAIKLPTIESSAILAAFDACHSQAEVYYRKDIETVFGKFKYLDKMTMLQLVARMRANLGQRWRQPKVQQEQKTKRSNKELIAEVKRGYQLAGEIIDEVQKRDQYYWQAQIMQAQLIFDHAEFLYGQEENLEVYTAQRDKSLNLFKQATAVYLKYMNMETRTADPYIAWFNALLGASDLSVLTRQHDPETERLTELRNNLLSLNDEQSDWHLSAFGESISQSLGQVQGELKPRYLKSSLLVLGDHKSGDNARELLAYYDDLLSEISLHVAVDGTTDVGETPFGVQVALRHTDAIAREAGGFAKYLSNQVYINYNEAPVDYRDDLEKQMRETLSERFDLIELSFHEPTVQAISFGRERWLETPIAYALLKTKDASVDRLPSLHLDMDFQDGHGSVILPIEAGEQLIDAHNASPRPLRDLKIEMILDNRNIKDGEINVEIHAQGKGVLPHLSAIVEALPSPWKEIDRISEQAIIDHLEIDDAGSAPLSKRMWRITYTPEQEITTFSFPSLIIEAELSYKRYVDADIEETPASFALSMKASETTLNKWYIIVASLIVAVLAWLIFKPRTADEHRHTHTLPKEISVFSVCALLRALASDQQLSLQTTDRQQITTIIQELENQHFSKQGQSLSHEGLHDIASTWLKKSSS